MKTQIISLPYRQGKSTYPHDIARICSSRMLATASSGCGCGCGVQGEVR